MTINGPCHPVSNFELSEGSNRSTLSPGENCLHLASLSCRHCWCCWDWNKFSRESLPTYVALLSHLDRIYIYFTRLGTSSQFSLKRSNMLYGFWQNSNSKEENGCVFLPCKTCYIHTECSTVSARCSHKFSSLGQRLSVICHHETALEEKWKWRSELLQLFPTQRQMQLSAAKLLHTPIGRECIKTHCPNRWLNPGQCFARIKECIRQALTAAVTLHVSVSQTQSVLYSGKDLS